MNSVNFEAMSDEELKGYFLANRKDEIAFQAYLDRFNQRPKSLIASPNDPDFDAKIQSAIRQKLKVSDNNRVGHIE